VVFLFPGQGTEFAGMSANAYEHHPEFRADIDAGAQQLRDSLGLDVRAVLLGDDPDGVIHRTDVTQPALVLHEYALGRLLLSWGVAPSAMIGHSVGEFAAACLAGEMSLADTLRLVVARGRLAHDAPAGGMVAVLGTVSACHQYLAGLDELDIAVLNGPEATVVAGPVAPLATFQRRLAEAGVPHRALPAQRAFHSRMMAAAAERLAAESVAVATRPRRHEIVSTIDGHLLGKRQTRPAGYWAEQLRRPVDFQCALQTASQLTEPVFVEVGPGDALCGMARQLMLPGAATVIALQASSRPARTDQALDALGALWAAGASPDWPAVRGRDTCGRAVLPAYPFARTRHWIGGSPALAPAAAGTPAAGDTPATGGPVLREVIDIWQNMLGAPGIGPESNFFELGGQSLLFIRMTARVQRVFDVALDVSELADAPTPLAVAEQIAGKVPR
jgi:acyl transferase domain-containing protein